MCDRFADTGTLENVLLSQHLALASKRAMLRVSKFFHALTDAHLRQPELHVSHFDCTVANARYVLRVLVPRVPGLLLCARDEFFAPKMDLAKLASLGTVRTHANRCTMHTTAAFFLGHALAQSDGYVRLSMGRKKSLRALRERDTLFLDFYERASAADCLLLQPCLLANAERRIAKFDGEVLDLSKLYLNDEMLTTMAERLFGAFDGRNAVYTTIDLSDNPFGSRVDAAGVRALVDALCNRRLASAVCVVGKLNLSHTNIHSRGIRALAAPMRCGGLNIAELYLRNVGMDDEGLACLLDGLRAPNRLRRKRSMGDGVWEIVDALQVLDLSENLFSDEGLHELLDGTGLSRLRVFNLGRLFYVSRCAMVTLAREVRKGLYPAIEQVHISSSEENVPMRQAVRCWHLQRDVTECDRAWDRFEARFALEEATRAERRKRRRAERQSNKALLHL